MQVIQDAADLAAAREYAIQESFGGTAIYELLKERNPQINMILNAGIVAGLNREAWAARTT